MENTEDLLNVISGDADANTKQSVLLNLDQDSDSKQEYNQLKNTWALLASEKDMPSYQLEHLYINFQQKLHSRKRSFHLNTFLKYAAVFILAAGSSSLYFYYHSQSKPAQTTPLFNTAVVAENGQRSKVVLPDSSVVWLNSGSKLTYNSNFGYTNRDIKLSGQALFEVSKNKKLPFILTSKELMIKVLGTRFDVDAYTIDENIRVALQTGRVELLHAKDVNFHYLLIPGQIAQFNNYSDKVVIREANMDRVTAWTDGILYFNDSPMKEVLIKLERKYNIDIEVKNTKIYESVFTATIKNETLDEIFQSIEYSCSVNCKVIRGMARDVKTKVIIQ